MTQDEYKEMLAEARDQLKNSIPLFGKDGAFHRVLEDFCNGALKGELEGHLQETKPVIKNRRNGKMSKTLQTNMFRQRWRLPVIVTVLSSLKR